MNHSHLYRFYNWVSKSLIALLLSWVSATLADEDKILWTVQWDHDGSHFAIGGENTLWMVDSKSLEKKSLLHDVLSDHSTGFKIPFWAVTKVSWHPNKPLLAVVSQGWNVNGIYDLESGKRTKLTNMEYDYGRGISWSPKGNQIAFASDDRLIISTSDGTVLHDVPRYKEAKGLTGVAWSPKGNRIITLGGRITLHDAQGKPLKQVAHRPEAPESLQLLLSLAWHPSGDLFVTADYGTRSNDPVLQFWSAEAELIKTITLIGDKEVRELSWNHDGSLLASASSKLQIWDRNGELQHAAKSNDLLWGVDWNPSGDKILTTSIEGHVTLWSYTSELKQEAVILSK
jgi:WD40 repeat protein